MIDPQLFTQAFLTRILPWKHEVLLGAIRNFDFAHYPPSAALAGAGALAASLLLYLIGKWLRRLPERVSTPEQRARIERTRGAAHHWLPYLLVFSPTPVGALIIIAAGFFALPPRKAAVYLVGVEVMWRAIPYLHS